jgi:hypothetical protein
MVLDIHCPEILQSPGKFAGLAPNLGWKEEGSWNFTITQMIAYVGRAYCKEHTIPVVKTVAPFLRDFPFHIHSRLPINAVQFTILSIIAMGYKPAVAYYRSECYRYCWPISITQQLIKRYSMVSATAPELISHGRNLDICNGMGSGLTWNRLEPSKKSEYRDF